MSLILRSVGISISSCGYTVSSIGATMVIRIDSSQQERYYGIIETEKQQIEIFNEHWHSLSTKIPCRKRQ